MARYNLKWRDEELSSVIRKVRLKYGKVTSTLLIKEAPGAYDNLWRRVKEGQFPSVPKAIEEISKVGPLGPVNASDFPPPDVTYVRNKGGRPLKWTDEEIMRCLVCNFLKKGRIIISKSNKGIYTGLYRRIRAGKFESKTEAVERLWFRGLVIIEINRAAGWLVDTTLNGDVKSIKRLNRLIEWEEGKILEVLKEIFRPNSPKARAIIEDFVASRRGKKLRELVLTKASIR